MSGLYNGAYILVMKLWMELSAIYWKYVCSRDMYSKVGIGDLLDVV